MKTDVKVVEWREAQATIYRFAAQKLPDGIDRDAMESAYEKALRRSLSDSDAQAIYMAAAVLRAAGWMD